MKKSFILFGLFALLLFSPTVSAQQGGLNFMLGFPQGEFKENVDRVGFGLAGTILAWQTNNKRPFTVGLNIAYLNYGSESRKERFSTTIPDVFVDVDRTNNLANFHLLFEISPFGGTVRPYIETLFGGSYLFTETKVSNQKGQQEIASTTNFDDWAWNYGGGFGIKFLVHRQHDDNNRLDFYVDLKARYLFGTEAEYLKEGSGYIEGGYYYFTPSKSKTDLLTVHLGVVVMF